MLAKLLHFLVIAQCVFLGIIATADAQDNHIETPNNTITEISVGADGNIISTKTTPLSMSITSLIDNVLPQADGEGRCFVRLDSTYYYQLADYFWHWNGQIHTISAFSALPPDYTGYVNNTSTSVKVGINRPNGTHYASNTCHTDTYDSPEMVQCRNRGGTWRNGRCMKRVLHCVETPYGPRDIEGEGLRCWWEWIDW